MIIKLTYRIHLQTMTQLISLGAINKLTNDYVSPKIKKMNMFVQNLLNGVIKYCKSLGYRDATNLQ